MCALVLTSRASRSRLPKLGQVPAELFPPLVERPRRPSFKVLEALAPLPLRLRRALEQVVFPPSPVLVKGSRQVWLLSAQWWVRHWYFPHVNYHNFYKMRKQWISSSSAHQLPSAPLPFSKHLPKASFLTFAFDVSTH